MNDAVIELPRRDSEHLRSVDAEPEHREGIVEWMGRHKKALAVSVLTLAAGGLVVSPQARIWALSALSALGRKAWAVALPWLRSIASSLYGLLPHATRLTLDGLLAGLHLGGKAATASRITTQGAEVLGGTSGKVIIKGAESLVDEAGSFLRGAAQGMGSMMGLPQGAPAASSFAAAGEAASHGGALEAIQSLAKELPDTPDALSAYLGPIEEYLRKMWSDDAKLRPAAK